MSARTWTITVPVEAWLTANLHLHFQVRSRHVHAIRRAVVAACTRAQLPTGITPVRLDAVVRYIGRTAPVRDRLNLAPTMKALVDGLTPHQVKTRAGKQIVSEGYGLLPDDSDRHVVDTTWRLERIDPANLGPLVLMGRVGQIVLTIHHIGDTP